MTEEKKSQKCNSKKNIMFAYGSIQLGTSIISAISLAAIAISFCSIKNKARLFNDCVNEISSEFNSKSEAVRYCNGGN